MGIVKESVKKEGADYPQRDQKRKSPVCTGLFNESHSAIKHKVIRGGVDGTRTRDPRRDRPVF